ncbi:MAG: sigma-70 family RNA polymerase sigma factor [Bacteroidota bacterium]
MTYNQSILNDIRDNPEKTMRRLYKEFRKGFMSWTSHRFGIDKEDSKDIFQETMVAFFVNAISGRLTKLTSTKAYIYAIGRNKILNFLEGNSKIVSMELVNELRVEIHDNTIIESISLNHRQQIIADAIGKLGENCQKLLKLLFFERFSHEAIAQRLNYSNAESSRTMRRRCLNNLEKMLDPDSL